MTRMRTYNCTFSTNRRPESGYATTRAQHLHDAKYNIENSYPYAKSIVCKWERD